MKKNILIILILQMPFLFAQTNVKVTYKAQVTKINISQKAKDELGKESSEILLQQLSDNREMKNEILKGFNFILKANVNESFYYWEEQIRDETVSAKYFNSAKRIGCFGKYYQNKKEDISIHQYKKRDNKWVREHKKLKDTAWVITKETDTILGYMVIKATKTMTLKKSPHPMIPKTTVQVAWFAPSLPMPFGPKGVGGLPGLVLRYGNIYATEIKFLKKPIKIKRPEKGELLDAEKERKRRIGELNKLIGED